MFNFERALNSKYSVFCMESVSEGKALKREKDNLRPPKLDKDGDDRKSLKFKWRQVASAVEIAAWASVVGEPFSATRRVKMLNGSCG